MQCVRCSLAGEEIRSTPSGRCQRFKGETEMERWRDGEGGVGAGGGRGG